MTKTIIEKNGFRFVTAGTLENGQPDYRIQKWDNHNGYRDMYLCDNYMQMQTAMDDFEYTKWLDPAGVPCYIKDD